MGSELARLRAFLTGIPSGDINPEHERELETLLGSCWDELAIADTGGMNPQKLFSRMENVSWHHPTLQFEIERHGGTVKGSVYAEMQSWSINVETGEASFDPHGGRRLVGQKNPSIDVNPIAEEIYELVAAKNPHPWLKWNGSTEVKILVGKVLPPDISQQTLRGRRKRLRLAIEKILVEHGWEKIGFHQFKKR
jgi:hypothetical protein